MDKKSRNMTRRKLLVTGAGDDGLLISVFMLQEGEDQFVAARLREILISALV